MKVGDLRTQLLARRARWSIPEEIDDDTDVEDLSQTYPLGAITPRPGTLMTRFPRMRRSSVSNFFPWQPKTHRLARNFVSGLPTSWDWRNVSDKNWVTAPKNQDGCGSCVAFGVVSALEIHQRIEKDDAHLDVDISEAALFFINERQCFVGDSRYGWSVPAALDFLADEGICYEENYPYRGVNQNAELVEGTLLTLRITGYDSTTQTSLMKRWISEEGPLIATFVLYNDFYTFWGSGANGIYTYDQSSGRSGGHVVAVIGYDDTESCWICKNSWGRSRWNDGCFRIGYGQCNIDDRMYLIQDVYESYTRDEVEYNPRNLRYVDEGRRGWLLTDGIHRLKMLDNKEDARNALRIARRHTKHGYIGRDNPRPNRLDYITEYWTGNSGLLNEPLTKVDSIPYNPNHVVAVDRDDEGWRFREGNKWMLLADDLTDALAILRVVERHTRICYIGRENKRTNRQDYVMTYWE